MVQIASTEKLKPYIQSEPVPVRAELTPDNYTPNLVSTAAFMKLYKSTSANNSILGGVQYTFIWNILLRHRSLSN